MKLIIEHKSSPRKGQTYAFPDADFITLGAKKDNNFVFDLPSDSPVSRRHAQIRQIEDKVYLQDLGTTTGTYVNGKRVTKKELFTNDIVQLGENGPLFVVGFVINKPKATSTFIASENKKYGTRTVGLMIEQALKTAGSLRTGMYKSTAYFEAVLEKRLNITTRKYRIILLALFSVILLLLIGLGVFLFVSSFTDTEKKTPSNIGAKIASENKNAIFLLSGIPADSAEKKYSGFCTAFAVKKNILATNAHCVEKINIQYIDTMVIQNETSKKFEIISTQIHSGYKNNEQISFDVGIIVIHKSTDSTVSVAPNISRASTTGDSVYMYGFPGILNNPSNPVATFVRGEIGRITTISMNTGSAKDSLLLQHSAISAEGTSGSPIFNSNGHVIAINAGGYSKQGTPVHGYNFALRIDLIEPLIKKALTN